MADQTDPRQRGFAAFSIKPSKPPAASPPRRGIASAPPPKPSSLEPGPSTIPPSGAPTYQVESTSDTADHLSEQLASTIRSHPVAPRSTTQATLGTPRNHMRYVQFQVPPALSELLTRRAAEEDLVLGEVVMDALRAFDSYADATVGIRRRRRASTSVRRSALVRPSEADEIKAMADRLALTPSALIRTALDVYLR